MALRPYRDEELNYFKFSSLVLNEFPKALRQTFKTTWDNTIGHRPGFQLWDDSSAVRTLFVAAEGGKTKVPTHQSYNEWDCTALFQATIFAQAFAIGGVRLRELYLEPRGVHHGSFHASVVSPVGDNAETVALAIDQLRLLRNSLCHSASSEMDKITFDQRVNYAKDAFNALGVTTASIDAIGSLTESDFPTNEVRKLELRIKEETRAYVKFLEDVRSHCADKDDISMLKHKLEDLIKAQTQRDETKNSGTELV